MYVVIDRETHRRFGTHSEILLLSNALCVWTKKWVRENETEWEKYKAHEHMHKQLTMIKSVRNWDNSIQLVQFIFGYEILTEKLLANVSFWVGRTQSISMLRLT